MPGRARHVYFEDELEPLEIPARRTRGQSSRPRSRSAERVHSIFDEHITTTTTTTTAASPTDTMQGRAAYGREAYDQLMRENQYLRIELRETTREKTELERENKELRRRSATAADYASDGGEKKEVSKLRKKYAKLEAEVAEVKARLSDWKKKAGEWRELFEQTDRRYEDVNRRLETTRKNYGLLEATNSALGKENATLRRRLEIEERINGVRGGGIGSPSSSRHAGGYY